MTFEEAAQIMMDSKKTVIKSISITENGTYSPPDGVDGYSPVSVSVPDRYNEGYEAGKADFYAKIKSKTITENGTYDATSEDLKAYNPVTVNVPDRYDEGYDEGYKAGRAEQGYTFPDGIKYDDICGFIGVDTVIDTTLGYGVSTETVVSPNDSTRQTVNAIVVDSSGKKKTIIYGVNGPIKDDWRIENIYVHNTGRVDMVFSYLLSNGERKTVSYNGYSTYLVGFGSDGNNVKVMNT